MSLLELFLAESRRAGWGHVTVREAQRENAAHDDDES